MPKFETLREAILWLAEECRKDEVKRLPPAPSNPYGRNSLGFAYDEGYWAAVKEWYRKTYADEQGQEVKDDDR